MEILLAMSCMWRTTGGRRRLKEARREDDRGLDQGLVQQGGGLLWHFARLAAIIRD